MSENKVGSIVTKLIPTRLLVKRLPHCTVENPIRSPAYSGDVGYDVACNIPEGYIDIDPGADVNIQTGIAVEVEHFESKDAISTRFGANYGIEIQVRPRSSTYAKRRVIVHIGTIDLGYRGEISVFLHNPTKEKVRIHHGDYVAQLIIAPVFVPPVVEVEELSRSERGTNGFGSSDSKIKNK